MCCSILVFQVRPYLFMDKSLFGQSLLQSLYVFRSHHVFPPLSSPRIVLTRCPRVPVLLQAKIASLDDAGFYDPFHAERARQGADKMNNISKCRFLFNNIHAEQQPRSRCRRNKEQHRMIPVACAEYQLLR